jgi:hypothetical protein
MKGEATCYKKRSGRIMKPKPRDSVIFIFRESIIVCVKAPQLFTSPHASSLPQINYWVSFQVSVRRQKRLSFFNAEQKTFYMYVDD